MINDGINSIFELGGAFILLLNVRRLYIDKCVKGCDWRAVLFFTLFGLWNVYYYPSLNQWYSFVGGVCLVIVNAVWLSMVLVYSRRKVTA